EAGLRFNASKLVVDPYALALAGPEVWTQEHYAYNPEAGEEDLACDYRDNAWAVPKAVVVDPAFDWEGDVPPRRPLAESVIYELHVRGFSMQCPDIPEARRGTYAALGTPYAIDYFRKLGITAVELLPVHQHVDDA